MTAFPYLSGWCGSARHDRCLGHYGRTDCNCRCHTAPQPEPVTDRDRAIAIVTESRQTHVEWAAYLRANPDFQSGPLGDAEYHERAVCEYDLVLAVLARCPNCHPRAQEAS